MILITGVAGFIGFHLAKKLLSDNIRVIGIDNLDNYYDVKLKKERLNILKQYDNFKFKKIDICNKKKLNKVFKNINIVYHMAAQAGVRYSKVNPNKYIDTNIKGTINIFERIKNKKIKLIMASTSSIYNGCKEPFNENDNINNMLSVYSVSKKSIEDIAKIYNNLYGINITVLRFFTVYGSLGRPDMLIYKIIDSIYKKKELTIFGNTLRNFTYIDDITKGIIKSNKLNGFNIINLGSGDKSISIKFIIKMIENIMENKLKIKKEKQDNQDMLSTLADITKAKKILNWNPETNIEDGLKKTIYCYLKGVCYD